MTTSKSDEERILLVAQSSEHWARLVRQTEALYPGFAPPVAKDELRAAQRQPLHRLAQQKNDAMPSISESEEYTRQVGALPMFGLWATGNCLRQARADAPSG